MQGVMDKDGEDGEGTHPVKLAYSLHWVRPGTGLRTGFYGMKRYVFESNTVVMCDQRNKGQRRPLSYSGGEAS